MGDIKILGLIISCCNLGKFVKIDEERDISIADFIHIKSGM